MESEKPTMNTLNSETLAPEARIKRLIICCDGTWQTSDNPDKYVESNVTNMARALSKEARITREGMADEIVPQVVYYQSGIGTGYITQFATGFYGGTGAGLGLNVLRVYNFLTTNYEKGDKLYLFGFSRGAYTARVLCGLLTDVGILKKKYLSEIIQIYNLYPGTHTDETKKEALKDYLTKLVEKAARSIVSHESLVARERSEINHPMSPEEFAMDRERRLDEFKAHRMQEAFDEVFEICGTIVMDVLESIYIEENQTLRQIDIDNRRIQIEIIGCWDTVGSLGVPDLPIIGRPLRAIFSAPQFEDPHISERVNHAFHALALDEHRRPFTPSLWHMSKKHNHKTELIQCWFPGVHINIGGGSLTDSLCKSCKIWGYPSQLGCKGQCYKKMEASDFGQLADLSFAWMVDLCRPYLSFDEGFLEEFHKRHFWRATHFGGARRRDSEFVPSLDRKGESIRLPTWADPVLGYFEDSFDMLPECGSRIRTPGEYNQDGNGWIKAGSPNWHKLRKDWVTHEYIHPSARIRLEQLKKYWHSETTDDRPWESPIQLKALRYFKLGPMKHMPCVFNEGHKNCDKTHRGLAWTKHNPGKDKDRRPPALVLPEWAVDSERYRELCSKTYGGQDKIPKSFERQIMVESWGKYEVIENRLHCESNFKAYEAEKARELLPKRLNASDSLLYKVKIHVEIIAKIFLKMPVRVDAVCGGYPGLLVSKIRGVPLVKHIEGTLQTNFAKLTDSFKSHEKSKRI